MIKQLYLVRHGEAEHMVLGLTGGWTDTSLTLKGREDAKKTAEKIAGLLETNITGFYSSDLKRAAETAQIIGERIGKNPVFKPELRERNNGTAKGLTLKEAGAIRNPETSSFIDYIVYPGGESYYTMYLRLKKFLEELNQGDEENILIVSHSNAITAMIDWWLEFDREAMARVSYHISECSLTQLGINKRGQKIIIQLNHQP